MNLVNARYGSEPNLKAYTHVSDRFGPFATQTIPATVNEAPYILDGLLMTRAGRRIREQYADSGGFTDHVFAVTSLLGYRFIPRIRDLPSKRLHVFEPRRVPKPLIGLTGNRIREDVIVRNWPDILRVAATLASSALPPSQLLRKFAAYPRQHELAVALREMGRVERTLFIVDWLLDADMQRRANTGLNKGEAHHALKNALRIGRQGEIRDRSSEGQHYRMAGLNPARRHRHLLEYRPARRSGQTAETRRPDGRARAPGPHLTPWMGPHPAHRRIPVAKAPIAALAYHSAPYQSRPQYGYLRRDGRYYWMDWSQDGCSIPVPSSWTTLFLPGCLRHDLAWRTLPVIDDDTGRVWNERNRQIADDKFLEDNRDSCSDLSSSGSRPLCRGAAWLAYQGVRTTYDGSLTDAEEDSVDDYPEFIKYPRTGSVNCAPTTGRCLPVHFLTLDGRPFVPQNIPYIKTSKTVDLEVERAHLMYEEGPPARPRHARTPYGEWRNIPELIVGVEYPVWGSFRGAVGCPSRGTKELAADSFDYRSSKDDKDQEWRDTDMQIKLCRDTRSSEEDDILIELKPRQARYKYNVTDPYHQNGGRVRHYENIVSDSCQSITVSEPYEITGSLLGTDCRSTRTHGGYADFFSFHVSSTDDYVIDLMKTGESIDPYLYLVSGTSISGAETEHDDDGGDGRNSRIEEELDRGWYTVIATNYGRGRTDIGDYRLRIRAEDDCPTQPFPGNEIDAQWTDEDCENGRRSGAYFDFYTFEVEGILSRSVRIDLDSDKDTYLFLISGDSAAGTSYLEKDDDDGPGSDARITRRLSPGKYTIGATTYYGERTGDYTLEVSGHN